MKTYTVTVDEYGTKLWRFNDKLHCEHGPAVEYSDGTKFWYLNGERDRTDGPAVEWANGNKFWYLNGKELTETDWRKQIQKTKAPCVGKIVEIDGVKYKLVEA
jgi:hypothetical protein